MTEIKDFLKSVFLFSELSQEEIGALIEGHSYRVESFGRGELVYNNESHFGAIGFVMEGRLEVRRDKEDGSYAVLNTLNEGASFGVLSVFSDEPYPTSLITAKSARVVFFDSDTVKKMARENFKISENIIKFMAERISFLNKKIETFSGTRVEDRLFSYLKSKSEALSSEEFPLNLKKCSEAINAGRASVYRAIESLTESGVITFDNKKIKIISKERQKK